MTQQELIKHAKRVCKLSDVELAKFLKVSIHTLRSWGRGPSNKAFRAMPECMYEYIQLKVDNY